MARVFFSMLFLSLVGLSAQAAGLQNGTGGSFAYTPKAKPQLQQNQNQQKDPYAISDCGQRCAFESSAEVLSYYFLYAVNKAPEFNDPTEIAKTKRALQACLGGNTSGCTKTDRELLLARVTQYNYYRDIRRKILEAQTNAKALDSAPLTEKFGKKDPRIATEADVAMLRRMMAKKPTGFDPTKERDRNGKQPFKIDPNAVQFKASDKALLGGGFRSEYDFILNNYTQPQFTARDDLSTAYTNPKAAAYAQYEGNDSGTQVQKTVSNGQIGRAATVSEDQYQKDLTVQNSRMVKQARQEFLQEHQNRDLTAVPRSDGKVATNFRETGIDKLGLRPSRKDQQLTDVKPYQDDVRAINKSIDEQIAEKKAQDKDAQVPTYGFSINKFDEFLDQIWPVGAAKPN